MPFKVVQTLEGKKYKLFTVPSGWETNNVLRYPNKCISKYIKDENSTPMPDWDVIKCKVKRSNVSSYENGEKLVSDMLMQSDTEDDVDNYTQRRRPQNKKTLNLNSMAQDMLGNVVLTNRNIESASTSADLPIEINYNVGYVEDIEANSTKTTHALSNDTPLLQDSVSFDINQMFENQKHILDNQATIINQILQNQQQQLDNNLAIVAQIQSLSSVQNSLIQKVSALSVQLEDAVSQITSSFSEDVLTLNSSKGHVNNIPIHVKPVDSAQDLNELEKQLSDPNNRDRLKNTYSVLCSGGKAIDCAYMLVDVMFTRKFMCECSWSGGSRGEDLKVPIKGYKHVLSFFWIMVHYWDQTYSLKDNELFFKTILKNAKKRKLAKLERASTSRQRSNPKNKRMKFAEKNAINESCDNDASENEINDEENMRCQSNDSIEENKKKNKKINESIKENTEVNQENDAIENISKDLSNSNAYIGKETSV